MKSLKKIFQKDISQLFMLILSTLLLYKNIYLVPFLYDDFDFLFTWKQIQSFSFLPSLLLGNTPLHHEGVYRPVRSILYVISYHFYQQNLLFYHMQEMIIYVTCIVLIYFITKKLTNNLTITFITTAIFAIHPMHLDTVANLTANFDSVGIVWVLVSFYLFQLFIENKKNLLLYCSWIFCLLAFFSYEITLIMPLLLICYGYFKREKKYIFYSLPYWIILFGYMSTRLFVVHIPERGIVSDQLLDKTIIIVTSFYSYFLNFLLPLPISPPSLQYTTGLLSMSESTQILQKTAQQLLSPVLLLQFFGLITLIIVTIKKFTKRSLPAYAGIWYFISMIPIIFIGFHYSQTQFLWNRYAFIASYAGCLLLGYLGNKLINFSTKRFHLLYIKCIGIGVLLAWVIYFCFVTFYNISQWRDQRQELIKQIAKNTNIAAQDNDLGVIAASYQQYDKAIDYFKKSLQRQPHDNKAIQNLKNVCVMSKDIQEKQKRDCL